MATAEKTSSKYLVASSELNCSPNLTTYYILLTTEEETR